MAKRSRNEPIAARPNLARAKALIADRRSGAVYVEIEGVLDQDSVERLRADMAKKPNAATLHITVNSPGGLVDSGAKLYQLLSEHPAAKKVAVCRDTCASAAIIPFLAADVRHATESARFCIHPVSADPLNTTGRWTAAQHRRVASLIDGTDDAILNLIVERTGASRDQILAEMATEHVMSPWQALSVGLIHTIRDRAPLEGNGWRSHVQAAWHGATRGQSFPHMGVGGHKLREGYIRACEIAGRPRARGYRKSFPHFTLGTYEFDDASRC